MNIDQAKKEAQALSGALRTLGIADISATQALEAVAKMKALSLNRVGATLPPVV